ncbi:MAG: class I SAM-dependent methyltransferase [Bacillota bacterium]
MIEIKCLCGDDKFFEVIFEQNFIEEELSPSNFEARGKYDLGMRHMHYRILRCNRCGQLYSNPILELEKIEELYAATSQENYGDESNNIVKSYFKPLLKWQHLLTEKEAVLEVGCGGGICLRAFRDMGFKKLIGVEPSKKAVDQAEPDIRDYIHNTIFEHTSFEPSSLNLICAFQVLDHFLDPAATMQRFHQLLKPGGLCYTIIHNEKALQVKLFKTQSPIIDVSHIYYFNRKTLRCIFLQSGFEVVDIFHIWNAYAINTWLRMAPIPFKEGITRLMNNLGLGNMIISIPAGNIGLIGRKKDTIL